MRVIWSKRALASYYKVADYLKDEWGDVVVKRFIADIDKVIEQINKTPQMFQASGK